MGKEILYENILSPKGHVCTESLPYARKGTREEEMFDVAL
jgi:hypothetical protein